ncbi:LCP family protein [Salipaludibacillus aurantiacus]|uniref:Cell envelope-related function transcriptional attenuator common domain-containing protein n=1 Tax=Salipaludibacillus aurantiacus TaxID=1601833 RepID=A0A1H9X5E9_9BACI|nr:LCP family protein [Salipaludibacillus aurantiacus]SES41299.1 cell envelope-related function transcriptional attenuator common domain-containing protein [Salipaludibacillus aurantiacus]
MALSRVDSRQKKTKKPRSFLKIALFTFLGVLIVAGSAVGYMIHQIMDVTSSAQQDLERGDRSEYREEVVNPDIDPVSVLFLGLDTRDGDLSGRTDAMVLVTFNPDEGTVKMLNIPRDTRVNIAGRYEQDKINHAHAFGGVDMTMDTVEQFLDIPVDYFVSLNFDAFMEIVDELNGIKIDSPMAFTETDNATYGTLTIQEGEQIVNGEKALAYVRMRKHDPQGDIGRGERQKEVIASIINEMATFSSITNFNSLMDTVERNLNTNATFNNIVSMHSYASELDNIESLSYDGTAITDNGIYYYQPDEQSVAETSQRLQKHLGIIEETESDYASASDSKEKEAEEEEQSEPVH